MPSERSTARTPAAGPSSLSDLAVRSDQRERSTVRTPAAGPSTGVHKGDEVQAPVPSSRSFRTSGISNMIHQGIGIVASAGRRNPLAAKSSIRRIGEYWIIAFEGEAIHLRHAKGLTYLAQLLCHPGEELRPSDLIAEVDGASHGSAVRSLIGAAAEERARVNVTRSLHASLARILAHHPGLGQHLRRTIRTGRVCSYAPDPRLPIKWET